MKEETNSQKIKEAAETCRSISMQITGALKMIEANGLTIPKNAIDNYHREKNTLENAAGILDGVAQQREELERELAADQEDPSE